MRLLALLAVMVVLGAPPATAQEPSPPQEPTAVQGGGSAAEAAAVGPGSYTDLIREPETLWYAIDAQPGQEVAATVVVRGRPEGPTSATSQLHVALLDAQRQPSADPAATPFDGATDTQVQVTGEPLPHVGAEGAYLTVTLASPAGANPLRDLGYQLDFAIAVRGDPVPAAETATALSDPLDDPNAAPVQPEAQPARGSAVALVPVALFAFALGGYGGYELMRKRLRSR